MRYIGVLAAILLAVSPAYAEKSKTKKPAARVQPKVVTTQDEIELLRQQIRSGKTEVVSNVLNISDPKQAAKFWPLYRSYENELRFIGDKRVRLIEDYLHNYNSMSNEIASSLLSRALENQESIVELRRKYAGKISKEVSPVVAARFLQIESFIQKYVDLQLDGRLPLLKEVVAGSGVSKKG